MFSFKQLPLLWLILNFFLQALPSGKESVQELFLFALFIQCLGYCLCNPKEGLAFSVTGFPNQIQHIIAPALFPKKQSRMENVYKLLRTTINGVSRFPLMRSQSPDELFFFFNEPIAAPLFC